MDGNTSRRRFLAGGTTLALALTARIATSAAPEPRPEVTVYKSPT